MKKFVVYCLSLIVFAFFASPVLAKNAPLSDTPTDALNLSVSPAAALLPTTNYQLPTPVSPTSPLYTDLLVQNMFHTLSCLGTGQSVIGQPCLTYQLSKNAQGVIQGVPVLSLVDTSGGVLGTTGSLIDTLYASRPIRTTDYLASVGKNLGIVKEAKAQVYGSGREVLNPIFTLWEASRNISYIFMTIVFLIIGLMVMFRNKINPQTVISAQAALPGLIIGLIMITFSYFFAALITDTAFLGVNIVGVYFNMAQPGSNLMTVQTIDSQNALTIFSKFTDVLGSQELSTMIGTLMANMDAGVVNWFRLFAGIIGYQVGGSFGSAIGSIAGALGGTTTIPVLGTLLGGGFGGVAGSLIGGTLLGSIAYTIPDRTFGWVLYFVVLAILIVTMIKLLLKLINTYLTIIFLTITAPFQMLAAAMPGRQSIATGWIMSMLSNVLVFPAVFAVLYFVAYLVGLDRGMEKAGELFGIPNIHNITGRSTLPLFGGFNVDIIKRLMAFGALLATPSIPEIISRALGRFSQAGQLIGQEIGGGVRQGQGYAGQFGNRLGGAAGSLQQGLGGQTQYMYTPGVGWTPYTASPSIFGPRGLVLKRGLGGVGSGLRSLWGRL